MNEPTGATANTDVYFRTNNHTSYHRAECTVARLRPQYKCQPALGVFATWDTHTYTHRAMANEIFVLHQWLNLSAQSHCWAKSFHCLDCADCWLLLAATTLAARHHPPRPCPLIINTNNFIYKLQSSIRFPIGWMRLPVPAGLHFQVHDFDRVRAPIAADVDHILAHIYNNKQTSKGSQAQPRTLDAKPGRHNCNGPNWKRCSRQFARSYV